MEGGTVASVNPLAVGEHGNKRDLLHVCGRNAGRRERLEEPRYHTWADRSMMDAAANLIIPNYCRIGGASRFSETNVQ